jgi:membrane protease YdiL (CAAX protease family)
VKGDLSPERNLLDSRMRRIAKRRPLLTFFGLALGLCWVVALPLVLSPAGIGLWHFSVPEEWPILLACTPLVAALWVQWLIAGDFRISRVGTPWFRVLLGTAFGALLALLAFAVVPALVLANGTFGALHWPAILVASAPWWGNPLNLLGGPLNEEPAWRGFALPRLQERYGPLGGSAVLGIVWTGWHLPLFLVQGWLNVPIWAYGILVVCLSVLMTWGINLSRGSVIPAVLMHAVFNSSFPILVALCRGVPTREPGLTWYVVGVVVATVITIAATQGRLGYVAVPGVGSTGAAA